MKSSALLLAIAGTLTVLTAQAADYALSPDGAAVVRLTPQGTVAASSLSSSLLPAGWTASSGTGGTASITSYTAAFDGTTGGAEIKAFYDNGGAPPSGSGLQWVQVLSTNLPLGGNTSPYLDNAADTSKPFYSYTVENMSPGLAPGTIDFYDFSKRDPASLASTDPITWSASLYPVITKDSTITVQDGVSWGWTMTKATVGSTTGTFSFPTPASAVVSGVGTSTFAWGSGSPSSLSFTGGTFDTSPDTVFKLGTLTFHNGTIASGSGADTVHFSAGIHFDNVSEEDFALDTLFSLINTPNTSDPIASADQVSIGAWGYTFNVLEGSTAAVDIMAKLTTNLSGVAAGVEQGAALLGTTSINPAPTYTLTIVGLADPTSGGFVTVIPEPSSVVLAASGLLLMIRLRKPRLRGQYRV